MIINKDFILDFTYPVGSIYMSVNSTNPSTLFGGTWERIQGRFLLGASSSYTAGSTGGQDQASAAFEMFGGGNNNRLYHDISRQDFSVAYKSTNRYMLEGTFVESHDLTENQFYGIKVTNLNDTSKLMPPYLAVYIWKRIA